MVSKKSSMKASSAKRHAKVAKEVNPVTCIRAKGVKSIFRKAAVPRFYKNSIDASRNVLWRIIRVVAKNALALQAYSKQKTITEFDIREAFENMPGGFVLAGGPRHDVEKKKKVALIA